jgi:hypothetical protein
MCALDAQLLTRTGRFFPLAYLFQNTLYENGRNVQLTTQASSFDRCLFQRLTQLCHQVQR